VTASRPTPHHILIVSHADPDLYAYLANRFADDPAIQVILDRRFAKRRQSMSPVAAERRQRDRRLRPWVDEELRLRSHVIVTLTWGAESVGEALQWFDAGLIHLPIISGVLSAYDQLTRGTEASKQEIEQLRAEVSRLRVEIDQYRREREDIGELVTRMNTMVNDFLSRLQGRTTQRS